MAETKTIKGPRRNQKLKIMYLSKIFLEETDVAHPLSIDEIRAKLDAYDVTAKRKSLYDDIAQLKHFGIKIKKRQSGNNWYYWVDQRDFGYGELKLLVDSVAAAKFITAKKSDELIKKITHLGSKSETATLRRKVHVLGRVKSINDRVFENMEIIQNAIANNVKISFKYCQWNEKKVLVPRNDGKIYSISPWALVWDNENYYMVGYDSDAGKPKHYRVDKMIEMKEGIEPRDGKADEELKDIDAYVRQRPGMFDTDKVDAELLCDNSMANVIIDRFGSNVRMLRVDENHFRVVERVAASRLFIHWILALGDGVKIIGPQLLLDRVDQEIKRLNYQYGDMKIEK